MLRALLWTVALCCSAALAELPVSSFEVIAKHPHDPHIFTQGLALDNGRLFQSSGLRGKSLVLAGPAGSLQADASFHFGPRYFAEGLALVGDEVLVLTWQAGELFVFDKARLQLQRKLGYQGEGWGLAYDGEQLWLSDGSARIRRFNPATMANLGSVEVHDDYGPVRRINELEWVNGTLLANIWQSTRLIAIETDSGRVVAEWDLTALLPAAANFRGDSVANGIAFDGRTGHIWLTGKGWDSIYEVELKGLPPE